MSGSLHIGQVVIPNMLVESRELLRFPTVARDNRQGPTVVTDYGGIPVGSETLEVFKMSLEIRATLLPTSSRLHCQELDTIVIITDVSGLRVPRPRHLDLFAQVQDGREWFVSLDSLLVVVEVNAKSGK